MDRSTLIAQLRAALHQAESPVYDVVEFEVGDVEFSFEFEFDGK